jgi:hypothetical protein
MKSSISVSELRNRYENTHVSTLAQELNLSLDGLYKLLDKCGIERKSPGHAARKKRTRYEIVG